MSETATEKKTSEFNKNNPFLAKILSKRNLNKEGSSKETLHFEISLKGSGLDYRPGYSLGIFAQNDPQLVDDLIQRLSLDPETPIQQKDGTSKPLQQVMMSDITLNRASRKFVKGIVEKLQEPKKAEFEALIADNEKLDTYLFTRDYLDILNELPELSLTADEFVGLTVKANPRLYSIASSLDKHPEEVHLTIATVRYNTHGRDKKGLASGWLADHQAVGESNLPVFMTPNKHFKIPEDPTADIIMVGPGTGIAPFRAFLEQREIDQATGRNWLFFGDQHKATDFLYEEEFIAWQKSGLLTKLDLAFSRDQEHKIYVQDRMRENAKEIWEWIQKGASFYVCGDAKRMAKDVEQALIDMAAEFGAMSPEDAKTYIVKKLGREERRYHKDVY
ncbi:MAG: sulfite reductase subunit alpha [Verrucomicrobiota bacterium]